MVQKQFAETAARIFADDPSVIGLTVGGSWLTSEIDEFSDVDLILVTRERVAGNMGMMMAYAKRLGDFLSAFTGEHVGEPRLLICLYDNPLLHVDIKFLTIEEFHNRVEARSILLDKQNHLHEVLSGTEAKYPFQCL